GLRKARRPRPREEARRRRAGPREAAGRASRRSAPPDRVRPRRAETVTRPLLLAGGVLVAATTLAQAPPAVLYRHVTAEAASDFVHHAAPDKKFIVESMSGGVALLDFDQDGLLDIYLTDSLTVDTARDPKAARSALYRNLGNWKFEDVTEKAGVGHPGWAMGVC